MTTTGWSPRPSPLLLVRLPDVDERKDLRWRDSGEGGLAFYVLIPHLAAPRVICATMPPGPFWRAGDVSFPDFGPAYTDGVLLLGSTKEALYSDVLGEYFRVRSQRDLTPEGQALIELLTRIYGRDSLVFVTLLDT